MPLPIPVPKVSRITTPDTPRAAPKRTSARPAASASLSTVTSRPVALENTASTSVPIQDGSTLAADRATPLLITAGKVAPTGPVQFAWVTNCTTTSATLSGVDALPPRVFGDEVGGAERRG